MLKNYILASWRSLNKKLGFTLINIIGLAMGMATCLIIFLYVSYDLSYDEFQRDDLYRLELNRVYPEREVDYAFIPHSISPQMVEDFPEVVNQTRFLPAFGPIVLQHGDDYFNEERVLFTDSTFLQVINVPLIQGDPATALDDIDAIVITEETAEKLFGDEEALGQTIVFANNSLKVTGVAENYPKNSHLQFDYLIPFHRFPFISRKNWTGFSVHSYVQLAPDTDYEDLEEKLPSLVKQYADDEIRARNGISYDEYIEAGNGYNYSLRAIQDIHLLSNLEGEIKAHGNITYIYIFSIVAIFILLIATINFMNLSTARSTERAKEVGVRKVLGSEKRQLVGQFLTESVIITSISAVATIAITYLSLPFFNDIAGRPLSLLQIATPLNVSIFLLIILVIGLLAGLYPAVFIAGFSPLNVLKGKLKTSKTGVQLRNVLVVVQFAISIALISSTMLVFDQMGFLLKKNLGFDKDQVMVVENAFALNNATGSVNWERFETFKNQINNLPNVQSTAFTSAMPGDILAGYLVRVPGGSKESMMTRNMTFDEDMVQAMDIQLSAGRFFSRDREDSLSIVLNQSAIDKLGITDPIGKKIIHVEENEELTIIGVVEDFHFQSLHVALEPVSITSTQGRNQFVNKMVVRLDGESHSALQEVEAKWQEFVSDSPFQSYFLDQDLEEFYEAEKSTGQIFGIFTFLAILIACIVLLGLSAYVINQKVKEIGVRKVLGATVPSIILWLATDFAKLVLVAAVIAIPASYYWISGWLENFAYAVELNWVVFIVAGLAALLIAFTTISFQSIKAATANPVKSLRDE